MIVLNIFDNIADFFEQIGSFISSVMNMISTFFSDLIYIIKITYEMLSNIPKILGIFPTIVITSVMAVIPVYIILRLMGRDRKNE